MINMPPYRCVFGWHLYKLSGGMYGDKSVDCTLCDATHYTSWFEIMVYKWTGRLAK